MVSWAEGEWRVVHVVSSRVMFAQASERGQSNQKPPMSAFPPKPGRAPQS